MEVKFFKCFDGGVLELYNAYYSKIQWDVNFIKRRVGKLNIFMQYLSIFLYLDIMKKVIFLKEKIV